MPEIVSRFSPPPPPPQWPPSPDQSTPPFATPGPRLGFYPLTIGRVVSLSLNLFRFGWKTFVAINLVVAVPIVLATALLTVATYEQMATWQDLFLTSSRGTSVDSAALVESFPWGVALLSFVLSLLLGVLTVFANAALIHAIAATFGGGRASVRGAYRFAFGRARDLLVLYIVLTLAGAGLALLALFVPLLAVAGASLLGGGGLLSFAILLAIVAIVFVAAFLVIRFVFAIDVMVIEGLPAVPSLRRTYALVAGSMLRVIGYSLVFGLILGLIGLVISFVSVLIGLVISPPNLSSLATPTFTPASTFVQSLVTNLFAQVFSPILTIGFVLLYYDTRHRHGEQVPTPGGQTAAAELAR